MGTIAANETVDTRRVPGARVGEGGRRGVGDASGASSSVGVVNVDSPLPTVDLQSGEEDNRGGGRDDDNYNDRRLAKYCVHRALHATSARIVTVTT